MDPRGVEAFTSPPGGVRDRYRWTLVGLKPSERSTVLERFARYRWTLVGLKLREDVLVSELDAELQMDPRGVEAAVVA